MEQTFYSFKAETLQGKEVSMDVYRGKMVLIVNTASKCGLAPQFKGLEELNQKYRSKGLVILGFPCNQFANQEPGNKEAIEEVCSINYGVTFQMFSKIDVNGPDTHPLFRFLKKKLPGFLNSDIKWNFTKFLIDENGNPLRRFAPSDTPAKIDKYLSRVLEKGSK
jgi:glutathione peroxidase